MRRPPPVTTVDFEGLPIASRPHYPPEPVGVSIKKWGKKSEYFAWGHPDGNNCSKADARRALLAVWKSDTVLFHNAKFDTDVAETHMGCPPLPWDRVHDTMFLLFLLDPHASNLALKPSAERFLNWPPEEQDAVEAWVLAHMDQLKPLVAAHGVKLTPSKWGAAIGFAPAGIVAPYARGDTDRTEALYKWGWPQVAERGMLEAYDKRRRVLPIFLANEREGMRCDVGGIERDLKLYRPAMDQADNWLRKRLKSPDLNLNSDADVAEALSRCGIVDDDVWELTATGKRSVSKKTLLPSMYNDAKVASVFGYRNRLSTCANMFMQPWLDEASITRGQTISTNWNIVRQPNGGTRTGRPSTDDHNFLNVSKSWHDKNDGYVHPAFLKLPELPLVRRYVLPDANALFCHRDFSGQELRVLAHYEDGALLQAYRENPRLDPHAFVAALILEITGLDYYRTQVKITNFRRIYGGGAPATASALNISIAAAKQLLDAHGKALPGVKDLGKEIKALVAQGEPIVTWGGREYYCEEPGYSKKFKRHMTYDYKLLNYLVQGSAADATTEALIRYDDHPGKRGRFMVTVYDEINASSAPEKTARLRRLAAEHELAVMKECMEGLEFDVPMLSDAKLGPNWADAVKYED